MWKFLLNCREVNLLSGCLLGTTAKSRTRTGFGNTQYMNCYWSLSMNYNFLSVNKSAVKWRWISPRLLAKRLRCDHYLNVVMRYIGNTLNAHKQLGHICRNELKVSQPSDWIWTIPTRASRSHLTSFCVQVYVLLVCQKSQRYLNLWQISTHGICWTDSDSV